jgi:hypothetical protein
MSGGSLWWLVGVLAPAPAVAAPVSLAWQGRFTDTQGAAVEGSHTITVSLYDGSDNTIWRKAHPGVAVTGGYASVQLGGAGDVGGTLDSGQLTGTVFVGVALDSAPELSPGQALLSVPRAAVATQLEPGASAIRLGTTSTCDATNYGTLRFANDQLEICSSGDWKLITTARATTEHLVIGVDGVRTWSDDSVAESCNAYKNPPSGYEYSGATGSGAYRIDPPGPTTALNVTCDMTFETGGWTLVARGTGGSPDGWKDTTGGINVAGVYGTGTYKLPDATINAIPKTLYRFVGTGLRVQTWFWDATACPTYGHTTIATGGCNRSYHTSSLSGPLQGTDHANHRGLGDWNPRGGLHTGHITNHWYMRVDDVGGDPCHGNQAGCDVLLYVR